MSANYVLVTAMFLAVAIAAFVVLYIVNRDEKKEKQQQQ